jgi:plasmid stabilization system protein ParE
LFKVRELRLLLDHPRSARADDAIMTGLRSMRSGSHRIYYPIDSDTITIHRILHMAADVGRWLE